MEQLRTSQSLPALEGHIGNKPTAHSQKGNAHGPSGLVLYKLLGLSQSQLGMLQGILFRIGEKQVLSWKQFHFLRGNITAVGLGFKKVLDLMEQSQRSSGPAVLLSG